MSKAKNWTLQILSLLCLLAVAGLCIANLKYVTPVNLLALTMAEIPLGALLVLTAVLGGLAMFFKLWDINLLLKSEIKQFEHRREKAEVKAQTNSDQVKALEAKVQTLEKALEKALSSSQSKSGN